jgi:hypothetical protein
MFSILCQTVLDHIATFICEHYNLLSVSARRCMGRSKNILIKHSKGSFIASNEDMRLGMRNFLFGSYAGQWTVDHLGDRGAIQQVLAKLLKPGEKLVDTRKRPQREEYLAWLKKPGNENKNVQAWHADIGWVNTKPWIYEGYESNRFIVDGELLRNLQLVIPANWEPYDMHPELQAVYDEEEKMFSYLGGDA